MIGALAAAAVWAAPAAAVPAPEPAPALSAPAALAAPPRPVPFTVAATGDFLIHTPVAARALADGGGRRYDFRPMFGPIRRWIAGADLALCHVETPLVPGPVRGYPSFRTPPDLAWSAKAIGWDACDTASNHTLDAGEHGVRTTIAALRRAGLRHVGSALSARGARRAPILDVHGVKVAFLAYTAVTNGQRVPYPWNLNWADPGRILRDARAARRRGADTAIVNLHWGSEYGHAVTSAQAALARRLTRSPAIGAIVGQHVHVVQPIRWMHRKPVVFGEGNLVSNQTAACCPPESQDGLIALIDFVARGKRVRARRVRYVPVWVRHPDYVVLPAPRGSTPWRRTVAVAGNRPGVRPVR